MSQEIDVIVARFERDITQILQAGLKTFGNIRKNDESIVTISFDEEKGIFEAIVNIYQYSEPGDKWYDQDNNIGRWEAVWEEHWTEKSESLWPLIKSLSERNLI